MAVTTAYDSNTSPTTIGITENGIYKRSHEKHKKKKKKK
eukprot:SAG11_NODE_13021_length_673_cov_4.853659_2_plen_38_part_01